MRSWFVRQTRWRGKGGTVARISKDEYPRILHMVDGEHRKVAEVAATYGCSAANIYALLNKLRRAAPANTEATPAEPPAPAAIAAVPKAITDLFAGDPPPAAEPMPARAKAAAAPAFVPLEPAPRPAPPVTATVTELPKRGAAKGATGAALAKPGMALVMRTAEGEENMTPFRSLDDLLSAVKPILRAAARSPDAVWFSIQPVDLAALDSDAA